MFSASAPYDIQYIPHTELFLFCPYEQHERFVSLASRFSFRPLRRRTQPPPCLPGIDSSNSTPAAAVQIRPQLPFATIMQYPLHPRCRGQLLVEGRQRCWGRYEVRFTFTTHAARAVRGTAAAAKVCTFCTSKVNLRTRCSTCRSMCMIISLAPPSPTPHTFSPSTASGNPRILPRMNVDDLNHEAFDAIQ
jgi:hypothetical protein